MILCLGISVCAQPRYSDNNRIILSLTFSASKGATCYGKITGDSGTTSITNCTVTLSDSDGNIVKSWSNLSSTGATLIFSKTATKVTKGESYTLSVTANVHRNGSSEIVSDSITATY